MATAACTDRSDTSEDGSGTDGTSSGDGTGGDDGATSGGDDGGTDDGGTGTGEDDGGTGTTGDDGSSSGTGSGGTSEPVPCGDGAPCDPTEYCDFVMNSCGTVEYDESECALRPEGCDGQYLPACGCDGEVYSNACVAAGAGVDVSDAGGCEAPDGMFPCGHLFCDLATQYCQHSVSDVLPSPDGFSCMALPPECGNAPSCDCLAGEPCADFDCSELPGGGFVLTCPGG